MSYYGIYLGGLHYNCIITRGITFLLVADIFLQVSKQIGDVTFLCMALLLVYNKRLVLWNCKPMFEVELHLFHSRALYLELCLDVGISCFLNTV